MSIRNDFVTVLAVLGLIGFGFISSGCAAPVSQLESQLANLPAHEAAAVEKVNASVVRLSRAYTGDGNVQVTERSTGFVLSEAVIVTGAHVVGYQATDRELTFIGEFADGSVMRLRVSSFDEANDFATLVPAEDIGERFPAPAVPLADRDPGFADPIAMIGSKSGYVRGEVITDPTGVMPKWLLTTNLAHNPGDSGSPLINERGQVVGMHVAGKKGQSLTYAIPVSHFFAR